MPLFAAFVSGEFTIKEKRGVGGGGAAPPHLQTFSSFATDCVFFALNPLKRSFVSGEFSIKKKKAGGLGGAQPPPICKLFSSFAIDCVFFALNPLQRCCLAFPFLCVCAPTPQQDETSRPQKAADRGTAGPGDHGTRGPEDHLSAKPSQGQPVAKSLKKSGGVEGGRSPPPFANFFHPSGLIVFSSR